jgi:2-phospho-L-lactate/phosphoenolpyruvate guanylyltransferase
MKTLVAIPMKDPQHAKSRLAPTLDAKQRRRLALRLFERTLSFFESACADFDLAVVTASDTIARHACGHRAVVLREAAETGLNAAAIHAATYARERAYARLIIVPGDIPVWLRDEVARVLQLSLHIDIVLAEARDGGTNMLVMRPPRTFGFCYGPDSASRHEAMARAQGLSVTRCQLPFIGHDIDTVEDCQVLADKRRHQCRPHEETTEGVS